MSGEIPCATPDNQSVRTTSGPLGPPEKHMHSHPYVDPRQPGIKELEFFMMIFEEAFLLF